MKLDIIVNKYLLIWHLLYQSSVSDDVHNLKQQLWIKYKKEYSLVHKDKEEILDAVTTVAGAPFVVTGRIIKSVAIVTTAPIWIPLLWWFFNKCDWTH